MKCWCCQKEYDDVTDIRRIPTTKGRVFKVDRRGWQIPLCDTCFHMFLLFLNMFDKFDFGVKIDEEKAGWIKVEDKDDV